MFQRLIIIILLSFLSLPSLAQPCLDTLWQHIYHPSRLAILDSCITVSGVVTSIIQEPDGDYHIYLLLDSPSTRYAQPHTPFTIEIICACPIRQADALPACLNYHNYITVPHLHDHVLITGALVYDRVHHWPEIHPVSFLTIIN